MRWAKVDLRADMNKFRVCPVTQLGCEIRTELSAEVVLLYK